MTRDITTTSTDTTQARDRSLLRYKGSLLPINAVLIAIQTSLSSFTSNNEPVKMCRTWNIKYACNDITQFRLSTCRGTFATPPKPGKEVKAKAACYSTPFLTFRSGSKCGPCQRKELEVKLAKEFEAVQARCAKSWTSSDELAKAQERYSRESFLLERRLPGPRFERRMRPEKGQCIARPGGSLLRQEVRPGDVVEKWVASKLPVGDGWQDFGPGWKSLGEEIAEREADESVEVHEYESWVAEAVERWEKDVHRAAETGDAPATPENESHVQEAVVGPLVDDSEILELASVLSSSIEKEDALPVSTTASPSAQQQRISSNRHGMIRGHNNTESDWPDRLRWVPSWTTVSS